MPCSLRRNLRLEVPGQGRQGGDLHVDPVRVPVQVEERLDHGRRRDDRRLLQHRRHRGGALQEDRDGLHGAYLTRLRFF